LSATFRINVVEDTFPLLDTMLMYDVGGSAVPHLSVLVNTSFIYKNIN